MPLEGSFTALITPFKPDYSIDWDSLEGIVRRQVDAGINGLVPCGTTGESPTLDHEEHMQVITRVTEWAKELNSEIKIIAGTGSNSTQEAIDLTKKAAKAGADYALLVNPYYNKPTQEGLYQHFKAIANVSPIPIILYNIPGRTVVRLELETIKKLSEHRKILAVKEATGDLNLITEIVLETDDEFSLLSGDDNLLLPTLALGGRGIISVCSNIYPAKIASITDQYLGGDKDGAMEIFLDIFPFCQSMFLETNPIPVKFAMSEMEYCKNILRLPLTPLSEKYQPKIRRLLKS